MKKLSIILFVTALFLYGGKFVSAAILNPYVVDDKLPRVFGDSALLPDYYGLENYTYDYTNGYIHISFTYTHTDCCFANYPPRLYITNVDPRTTSTPTIKSSNIIYTLLPKPIPPGHPTDWYSYDIQFDATGYSVAIRQAGVMEIENTHREIPGLVNDDWVALANLYPMFNPPVRYSMALAPVPIRETVLPPEPEVPDPVIIVQGIMGSAYKNGKLVIDPILHTYDDLIATLDENGYTPDIDLFTFPYEWRDSNVFSANLLDDKIEEIKSICECDKVDIVAHSMGGLVARAYIQSFDYDNDTGIVRRYPNDYPRNFFLESLKNNISSLLNAGVEITNIVGNSSENKTIEKIRVIPTDHQIFWEHGEPEGFGAIIGDSGLERGVGDNTVTQASSFLGGVANEEIVASHNRIPTVAESKVFNILTGKIASTTFDHDYGVDKKVLMLQLLSPIDVLVTAPNEKRIGKNFETGEEYDEIKDAFYSGFQTDNEYITILNPLDGEYKIEVQGTGSGGEYGILTSYISEGFATTTETVGITKPNQVTNLEVAINNQNPGSLVTEREITLTVLINDIEGAYDLGWIKDQKTRDELIKKVEKIYKKDKKIDKKLAKTLSLTLKLYRKEKINEQAYNLIKTDLEWLINN